MEREKVPKTRKGGRGPYNEGGGGRQKLQSLRDSIELPKDRAEKQKEKE